MIQIYFNTSDWNIIRKIQERFKLPKCVTVNGELTYFYDRDDKQVTVQAQSAGWSNNDEKLPF